MSSFWTQRILANLAQDRFAEGFWLTKQNGLEVKVTMIRGAILGRRSPAEADKLLTFRRDVARGRYGLSSRRRHPTRFDGRVPYSAPLRRPQSRENAGADGTLVAQHLPVDVQPPIASSVPAPRFGI
jgi:hypothetical protein